MGRGFWPRPVTVLIPFYFICTSRTIYPFISLHTVRLLPSLHTIYFHLHTVYRIGLVISLQLWIYVRMDSIYLNPALSYTFQFQQTGIDFVMHNKSTRYTASIYNSSFWMFKSDVYATENIIIICTFELKSEFYVNAGLQYNY